ncbi:MAG: mechanosensitive ion channel family protein [Ferrovibrio sp.]|uniref:mechanosensitive ion channel family protein n=1 Tax=Ferrovibrio sp. TaxID=1917215 RepID=UPI0026390139|nr:mechanosensitive ion channel family protein [Ferrovibrio sp.]MCW0235754.1 mechanosensitive ion channel family protein [Ferrovibrio sp.]
MNLKEYADIVVPGGTIGTWLFAFLIASATLYVAFIIKRMAERRLRVSAAQSERWLEDVLLSVVSATRLTLVSVLIVAASFQALDLSPRIVSLLGVLSRVAFALQAGLWGSACIGLWIERARKRSTETGSSVATGLGALKFIALTMLWALIVLLVLNNAGIDITALVAGLGVGGIAIALAVQNVLGDLFASLSIILDKPFVAGDFVVVDEYMGTIEAVGLKTTRVRSLGGEQIIFSNSDLLKSRLRNYKRMYQRRVVFSFGVTYQTTPAQLESLPGLVRQLIDAQEKTNFDRAHFAKFGDSSLDFEVVYWVLDADYNVYMDIHQAIHLGLFRQLGEQGIDFAYPTQTLQISGPVPMQLSRSRRTGQPARLPASSASSGR